MAKPCAKISLWQRNQQEAIHAIRAHCVLGVLAKEAMIVVDKDYKYVSRSGWLQIGSWGYIWLHPEKRADVEEWVRIIALGLLNLGFGHVEQKTSQVAWELSSLLITDRFCNEMNIGRLPETLLYPSPTIPSGGIEQLFKQYVSHKVEKDDLLSTWYKDIVGDAQLFYDQGLKNSYHRTIDWKRLLATGISHGVDQAIATVANRIDEKGSAVPLTNGQKAKQWIIDNFPLLGAMAAGFELIEDIRLCQNYDISIAAINVSSKCIYLNPTHILSPDETRFILAHELLHAGLNHASRRKGRDPHLWNIACDFVINTWLIQMQIGVAPQMGLLYDEAFENLSAEEVYDELATNLRRSRRLITMRGNCQPDMIGEETNEIFTSGEAYCRRALMQGLNSSLYSKSTHRGLIPAGLIEEIRSLNQPPIPWDVRLAEWFDEHFPPLELRRTYARPSRRQSATPDIPRASITKPSEESRKSRVFGVILDTSGSMEPQMLGKAIGAIASYALARDVSHVRFICCDAYAYDSGWVEPEQLLYRFAVKGRGGTILQPAIDLLNRAAKQADFPLNSPVLIITDGECESYLNISMTHAYLLPQGKHLPFVPKGKVFYVS